MRLQVTVFLFRLLLPCSSCFYASTASCNNYLVIFCYLLPTPQSKDSGTEHKSTSSTATARKVSRLTIVIILSYSLCWLPYYITVTMIIYRYISLPVFVSVTWLSNLYSALNPVICISLSTNFRQRLPFCFERVKVTHRDRCRENRSSFVSNKKFKAMDTRL